MIAKFNGTCKVTGRAILAGKTEIVKVNGVWQVPGEVLPEVNERKAEQAVEAIEFTDRERAIAALIREWAKEAGQPVEKIAAIVEKYFFPSTVGSVINAPDWRDAKPANFSSILQYVQFHQFMAKIEKAI